MWYKCELYSDIFVQELYQVCTQYATVTLRHLRRGWQCAVDATPFYGRKESTDALLGVHLFRSSIHAFCLAGSRVIYSHYMRVIYYNNTLRTL